MKIINKIRAAYIKSRPIKLGSIDAATDKVIWS